jgi:hypothetical protein
MANSRTKYLGCRFIRILALPALGLALSVSNVSAQRSDYDLRQQRAREMNKEYLECRARLIDTRGNDERIALNEQCNQIQRRMQRCQSSLAHCDPEYQRKLEDLWQSYKACRDQLAYVQGGERLRVVNRCQELFEHKNRCESNPSNC